MMKVHSIDIVGTQDLVQREVSSNNEMLAGEGR